MKIEGLGWGRNLYVNLMQRIGRIQVSESERKMRKTKLGKVTECSKMGLTRDVYSRIMVSGGVFVEMVKDES